MPCERNKFFDSALCRSRAHCGECRHEVSYRRGIAKAFGLASVDFACPHGVRAEDVAPPEAVPYPSPAVMAANLAGTARDVAIGAWRDRRVRCPDDLRAARQEACNACHAWDAGRGRCRKCGCFMRVKQALLHSSCPLGKWPSAAEFAAAAAES